jgi:hypothetical protein
LNSNLIRARLRFGQVSKGFTLPLSVCAINNDELLVPLRFRAWFELPFALINLNDGVADFDFGHKNLGQFRTK